jgi:hypothetical protein
VAVDHRVFSARVGVHCALHEDVFDGLDWLAALARNLAWGVAGEESLCVLPDEGVSCNDPEEC